MDEVEQGIAYVFADKALLQLALTHPGNTGRPSNQRLEFLGDSVLAAAIAELLYESFPEEPEGSLALRLNALVGGTMLTKIAQDLHLGKALHLAPGDEQKGGRQNASNLEDALEALIGAIYLDGGYDAARSFIRRIFTPHAKDVAMPSKDAKTSLQEWAQGKGLPRPEYRLIASKGAAHAPLFTMEVEVQGYAPVQAEESTKRAAEQKAAAELLAMLKEVK